MDAVFGVLSTAVGIISGVFGAIGGFFSLIVEILGEFGVLLFIASFLGLLLAFLWFVLRYIDKRRLTLPAVIFTLFFLIFLGGNILMLAQDARTKDAEPEQTEAVQSVDEVVL